MKKFRKVVLPYKWSNGYTYLGICQRGAIVRVAVKNRELCGVVVGDAEEVSAPKEIISSLPNMLPNSFLLFLEKASEYNMLGLGEVLSMVLREPSEIPAWYLFESSVCSVTHLIKQLGKRKFSKLLKNGALEPVIAPKISNPILSLTKAQQECIANSELNKPLLLWGATGSGKTNVYFSLLSQFLDKQCVILLPEVALTEEFVQKVYKAFGVWPHVWHHKINSEAKDVIWSWAISGKPGILIGSRSALWLPLANLGFIVIDEEHDDAFKQDSAPRYHCRDMAVLRASIEGCPIVLVSATPSLETWRNVQKGKYNLTQLSSNPKKNALVVKRKFNEWLTVEAKYAMINALQSNGQVLLFLNRRGFASNLFCTSCSNVLLCKYCSASMIIYKNLSTKCSYCGYSSAVEPCKSCNKNSWQMYGMGIEKVSDELTKLFPSASIAVLSSDTEEINKQIQSIHENKVQIIIATQVLSKGHHFNDLKLVVVLQGDSVPSVDPRHTEKVYQLLTQVMGRFGNDKTDNLAIIQSITPENKLIKAIAAGHFQDWAEEELRFRETHSLPPFCNLIRITVGSPKFENSYIDANFLYEKIKNLPNIQVYRPAPTRLYQYKNVIRHYLIIRHGSGYPQPKLFAIISNISLPKKSQIITDVDPRSFF